MNISDEVRTWLQHRHDAEAMEDAAGHAPDPIAERLLTLTRSLRPVRATVAGAVVVHHPAGTPFAAAVDGCFVVRLRAVPGTLAAQPVTALDGWVAVDPFPPDVAFARGDDVLRRALVQACTDAGVSSRTR